MISLPHHKDVAKVSPQKRSLGGLSLFLSSLFPAGIAFAQGVEIPSRIMTLMGKIYTVILNPLIGLLFGLAFTYFIYGTLKYVWHGDEEAEREAGRRAILWGIIGMFVMFSVFGILRLVIGTIGADTTVLSSVRG